MSFIKKLIPSKKIIIIDIGTYKIKTALLEYKNNEIHLLSFCEKKQESSDIIGSEIANIGGVSESIELAISKLLKKHGINPNDIIINIPTSSIISSKKDITYIRTKPDENITLQELDYIIGKAERESLNEAKNDIKNKTGYSEVDMKLITSSITSMSIDDFKVSNPIGFTGKEVYISILNIFIPSSRYNIITNIGNYLGKNILSILPQEFCIPKILSGSDFAYDDVIFLDIGNTRSSIIIQKAGVIIGFDNINIGISDLVKSIKEKTGETNIEIINNLQKDSEYLEEKKEFLSVWEEGFILTIKDILKSNLVPYKIFISGGGDNNFLREYIKNIDLNKYGLHSLKKFTFLSLDLEKDINIIGDKTVFNKTTFGILSMIIASRDVVNYKNNPVLSIIREFLEKNEF
ncbi:MAG: hypothetical protein PHE25_04545 [Candidatus Gracilibacteria bacterium]|nr:hypothetical protein [Candidatus Gracilibacteria bacterium]